MASVHRRVTKAARSFTEPSGRRPGPTAPANSGSKNFGRATDARAYAAQKEQEERRGVGDPDKHTCEKFLRRWLATLRDRDEHSPTTIAGYTRPLKWRCERSDMCRSKSSARPISTMPMRDCASAAGDAS